MNLFNFFKKKPGKPNFRQKYNKYDRGMDTESQGGVWISSNPDKFTIPNTADEVDYDKMKGLNRE
ncbi:MAG: hypothetical protein ACNS62_02105 [Candidatus Cyclobacteriaceae bacterium M3_2C_046]